MSYVAIVAKYNHTDSWPKPEDIEYEAILCTLEEGKGLLQTRRGGDVTVEVVRVSPNHLVRDLGDKKRLEEVFSLVREKVLGFRDFRR